MGQWKTIIKICLVFFSLFYGLIFRITSYLSALAIYSLGRSLFSFLLSLQSMANHPAAMQLHSPRSHHQKGRNYCLLSLTKTPSPFILILWVLHHVYHKTSWIFNIPVWDGLVSDSWAMTLMLFLYNTMALLWFPFIVGVFVMMAKQSMKLVRDVPFLLVNIVRGS